MAESRTNMEDFEPMLQLSPSTATRAYRGSLGLAVAIVACTLLAVIYGMQPSSEMLEADAAAIQVKVSQSNAAMITRRHNIYRCMHGAPPLKWSGSLARSAQQTVDRLGYVGILQLNQH